MWPKTWTGNFSKSGLHKTCTFINVYLTFTCAATLVKVCFYLILKILLLMGKLSHKLGEYSIISLTEIDFGSAVGYYQQVKATETTTPSNAGVTPKVIMKQALIAKYKVREWLPTLLCITCVNSKDLCIYLLSCYMHSCNRIM